MILGSFVFAVIVITFFTYLDLKNREVPKSYIKISFLISFILFICFDCLIKKTVMYQEIFIGLVCFFLCYLFMTPGVICKVIGPADVRIFSIFLFLTPVYTYSIFGKGLIPSIDSFLNFLVFIVPTCLLFRLIEPERPAPALVAISAAIITTMTVGNLPIMIYDFAVEVFSF